MTIENQQTARQDWIKESTFGVWFLSTDTWVNSVLKRALDDLESLMRAKRERYPAILDVGCGHGHSLLMLDQRFHPEKMIGLDVDPEVSERSADRANACNCDVQFMVNNAASMELPDASVDMIFCHQTFHHIVDQTGAAKEFYRVLKPGGVLLFAESCRSFIHSLVIRVLFRHPMSVQKTDSEYLQLLEDSGFLLYPDSISRPYLWWSRSDLGLLEKLGKKVPQDKEETLVNVAAYRPE
jgi:ubiquinone/menaquinone biosynthesis C-methylase UbiE